MSAPLPKFSGAPVAQTECATGEFRLQINLAAHKRATALFAVAQRRSKLDFSIQAELGATAQRRNAATQQMEKESAMENKTTKELTEMLFAINDELYSRGESPMKLIRDHALCRNQNGRIMRRADMEAPQ